MVTIEMKSKQDIFSIAIWDYFMWNNEPFFFKNKKNNQLFTHNLKRYFRKSKNFWALEKKLIDISYWNILDVWSATWYYLQELSKKWNTIWLEYSKKIVEIGKMMWVKNLIHADIFKYKPTQKFDTITLLENNIWLWWTVWNTKKLLTKLSNILNDNWQILSNIKRIDDRKFFKITLIPIFKSKEWKPIKWISLNPDFLAGICLELGLKMTLLASNKKSYLIQIKKFN